MFHLPDVLIDYIYSFDNNAYHKQNYQTVMNELAMWYSWRCTRLFLQNKHSVYVIYHDHNTKKKNPVINVSQYILWVAKNYSDCVDIDNMKWKLKNTKYNIRNNIEEYYLIRHRGTL